jgi:hypothetical protein
MAIIRYTLAFILTEIKCQMYSSGGRKPPIRK